MKNRYIPFGYQIQNGDSVINTEQAATVQHIFYAYTEGQSFKEIAEYLTTSGTAYHFSDNSWNKNIVARILANEIYCGAKGYPAIISKEVYSQAASIRSNKTVTYSAVLKPFRSDMQCACCGERLYWRPRTQQWTCRQCGMWSKPMQPENMAQQIVDRLYQKNGLNYTGDARGNLTKHSYFTSTACPGPYLGGKFSWLAEKVNKRLAGGVTVAGDALRAGMALHLERTNLYIASASLAIAGVRTGTYYLWGTEVVNGRVRITNSTSNVGKYGKVTGWISVDDAKAGAGLRDQTTDSRGLTKIVIDYASNVQAMAVYNLAQQLDLVAPGYYRSRYIDAAKTAQYIEIGQISAGDAEHVTTLCKKAAIEYKTAA